MKPELWHNKGFSLDDIIVEADREKQKNSGFENITIRKGSKRVKRMSSYNII